MITKKKIKEEISKQILMGGGETLIESIYRILKRELSLQKKEIIDRLWRLEQIKANN